MYTNVYNITPPSSLWTVRHTIKENLLFGKGSRLHILLIKSDQVDLISHIKQCDVFYALNLVKTCCPKLNTGKNASCLRLREAILICKCPDRTIYMCDLVRISMRVFQLTMSYIGVFSLKRVNKIKFTFDLNNYTRFLPKMLLKAQFPLFTDFLPKRI